MDNTHEVAQRVAPECRVVYVDNDPLVLVHAKALLTGTPQGATDYLHADLREPGDVLAGAARMGHPGFRGGCDAWDIGVHHRSVLACPPEFPPAPGDLDDALTHFDPTTSPGGQPVPVDQPLAKICARCGSGQAVIRAITATDPPDPEACRPHPGSRRVNRRPLPENAPRPGTNRHCDLSRRTANRPLVT